MSLKSERPNAFTDGFHPLSREITLDDFYVRARNSIATRPGLIHGSLKEDIPSISSSDDLRIGDKRKVCALGAFLADGNGGVLDCDATLRGIEEVQAYNDSMPQVSEKARKERVIGFLDAKIAARKKTGDQL